MANAIDGNIIEKMTTKTTTIIRNHVIAWSVFITYEVSFIYLSGIRLSNPVDTAFHYMVNICLFYLNASGFNYLFEKKIHRFTGIVLLIAAEIVGYMVVQYLLLRFLSLIYHYQLPNNLDFKIYNVKEIYRAIYFIGLSITYWFAVRSGKQNKVILEMENDKLRQQTKTAELERDLMQAKNAYLQSQLNPHLLFNTLSFIYNSVRKLSDSASRAILLLSDMMRYSLSDTGIDGKVSLENEIDHIKNMISLNQLRYNETLNIKLVATGSFKNETIIPLLLLSFIENMYKHGDLTDADNPAKISIGCTNRVLELVCSNKKSRVKNNQGWGIGVENARARLNIHYKDRYALTVDQDDFHYNIRLIVYL